MLGDGEPPGAGHQSKGPVSARREKEEAVYTQTTSYEEESPYLLEFDSDCQWKTTRSNTSQQPKKTQTHADDPQSEDLDSLSGKKRK